MPEPDTDAAVEHYVEAKLHNQQGHSDQALASLRRAISADPRLAIAHETMGDIHRQREAYHLAARNYEQAVRINPYGFRNHYNLGVTYTFLADAAETVQQAREYVRKAVGVYLRAITIDEDDYDANLNLSACYYRLGRYEQAEHYCRQAVRIRPGSAAAYSNLGTIYDAQERPYKAVRAYKDAIERDPNMPRLRLNLGQTYLQQGTKKSLAAAADLFAESARRNPDDATPREMLGLARFYLNDFDASQAAYEEAIDRDEKSAPAWRGLGAVLMRKYLKTKDTKLRDRALDAWQRSLEIDDRQPRLRKLLQEFSPRIEGPAIGGQ
jgi:tetratricopeptide (TPR) repeat protein